MRGGDDSNSDEPLGDFLQILTHNELGLSSEIDVHQFVKCLQNSFEDLCQRVIVKSHWPQS